MAHGSGEEASREEAFTFAHAAAVDPTYRAHFRSVPPEAWTDELVELGEWLDAPDSTRLRRVPYVWIVDDGGQLARAVLTRELTFACRERAQAWRILQELAGLHNEHARPAAERAREEARAAFLEERRALEEAHAEALARACAEAVGEAMDRLVAVLLGVGTAPGEPAPALATPVPSAEPAPRSEAAPASEAEPQVSFDEPYIDSVLCTTCNECTQLN